MRPQVKPQTVLDYMRTHRLAVQATVSAAGVPQAALVGFAVSDHFEIVFDTVQTTRKAQNLRRNSHVALVIGGSVPDDERTVQYAGEAEGPSGGDLARLKR